METTDPIKQLCSGSDTCFQFRLPLYILQGAFPPVPSFSVRGYTSARRLDGLEHNRVLQVLCFPLRFSEEKGQSLSSINETTADNSPFVFLEMHLHSRVWHTLPPNLSVIWRNNQYRSSVRKSFKIALNCVFLQKFSAEPS